MKSCSLCAKYNTCAVRKLVDAEHCEFFTRIKNRFTELLDIVTEIDEKAEYLSGPEKIF